MKQLSLLVLLFGCGALTLGAQKTTRPRLHAAPAGAEASATEGPRAVVAPGPEVLKVSGYDKPLRSRRETFFVANHDGEAAVERLALTITYLDSAGKMLHKREVSLPCDIPAGETRNLSIPSWDGQQSFYFVRSSVPVRAAQATPYDVTIAVDTVFVR